MNSNNIELIQVCNQLLLKYIFKFDMDSSFIDLVNNQELNTQHLDTPSNTLATQDDHQFGGHDMYQ